jgi:hypothetical protein
LPTRPSKAGKGELSRSSELKLERIETTLSKIEKNTKSRIEPKKKKKSTENRKIHGKIKRQKQQIEKKKKKFS